VKSRHKIAVAVAGLALVASGSTAGLSATAIASPLTPDKDAADQVYIVQTNSVSATGGFVRSTRAAGATVTHIYNRAFHGFSARLSAAQVEALRTDPKVESITVNRRVHANSTERNAPWGLDRIDQRSRVGSVHDYGYDTTGTGVTAYVIDTGIRFSHTQFGGRAVSGYDFVDGDGNASDCNGHGTHVAGTIGGSTYGIAKRVKLVGVRALDCDGTGYLDDVLASIDWVVGTHTGPSVINLSLGGEYVPELNDAIDGASAAGVTVVTAAGNDDDDACNYSPASAKSAITVGATNASDSRAPFSDWGSCVDVFAPGVNIPSAYWTSDTATALGTGTSMAAPHVTGVVARYLQNHRAATPAQVSQAIIAATTKHAVLDPMGSPNRLLFAAPPLPGKPIIKTASSGSTSDSVVSVTGRWAAPTSGGPVANYYVTAIRRSDGVKKTVVVSSTARSKKLTGLRRKATYVIRVYAKNAKGNGATSSSSNIVTAR
jgi:subtilisin family serine protease